MGVSAIDNTTPVVVLRDPGAALAIARSLGRLGVRVYLVTQDGSPAYTCSRYWTKVYDWDFSAPDEKTVAFLQGISREIGTKPLLLTIPDSGALFIEDNAAALEEHFIFSKPAPPNKHILTNKWEMFLAAQAHGIPVPAAMYPQSRTDVERFVLSARFPIVLKGADQRLPQAKWKTIVRNAAELFEKYDEAAASGVANLILQEYIPGGDEDVWMCNAYFDDTSACRAIFSGHKLRQTPPHAGIATLAVCSPNAVVEDQTRRFMQAVGYHGLCGIGWRFDARDGRYKVLDVNPRVSGVFRLFRATNGMDVVRACYLDLTGQAIPDMRQSVGRKWMLEEDIFAAMSYAERGELGFGEWLWSLRGVQESNIFAIDDPLPIIVWSWTRFGSFFRGVFSRAARRVRGALEAMFAPQKKRLYF